MTHKKLVAYIIAGEPSGDQLGAKLMASLKMQTKNQIDFKGIGGLSMESQGLQSLFPMSDISLMGFVEVVPHLKNILTRLKETIADIKKTKPDVLITIDCPGFSLRVAKKVKKIGIPVIHYSVPSVWGWRPGRAKKYAKILTHAMALFPFEPSYFVKEGLPCTFVGHPLVEMGIGQAAGSSFRKKYKIPATATVLCLLPGSRLNEVKKLLPVFKEALMKLKKKKKDFYIVIPTLPFLRELVEEAVLSWKIPSIITIDQHEKYQAMAASNIALAASGTVSLELALAGVPMVITYKVNPMTAWIVRKLIRVRHVCLVNIILGKRVVPELLQENCDPHLIAEELQILLQAKPAQEQMKAFKELEGLLQNGRELPSTLAAKVVLNVTKEHHQNVCNF
jgi:lipid-A-disaccharide synthase